MNANEYDYGTDPISGLPRRLVRDTAVVQEEMDSNTKPKAVVHLREQTYNALSGDLVTNKTAGYEVVKGELSYDVDGDVLPKYEFTYVNGELIKTPVLYPDGNPVPRNNGYENIIFLSTVPIPFDTVLDDGIKEYYKIS